MTVEDLNMALAPVVEAIEKQPTLEDLQELLQSHIETCNDQLRVLIVIVVLMGVIFGGILMKEFWDRLGR